MFFVLIGPSRRELLSQCPFLAIVVWYTVIDVLAEIDYVTSLKQFIKTIIINTGVVMIVCVSLVISLKYTHCLVKK